MSASIYVLIDPRTRQARYVGKTSRTLDRRLRQHIRGAATGTRPRVRAWIRSLQTNGIIPEIVEIEKADDWIEAEQFYIGYLRTLGCALLNSTNGGDGLIGYKHSPETRQKIGLAAKGKRRPPHVIEACRNAHIGSSRSAAAKERMRNAWTPERINAHVARCKDRPTMSAEQRQKISSANSGRKFPKNVVEARAQKLRGRKHTEEQKRKAGEGVSRSWTPERRAAQALIMSQRRRAHLLKGNSNATA